MLCQHVEIATSEGTRHGNADSQMHDLMIIYLSESRAVKEGRGEEKEGSAKEAETRDEGLTHARPPFHCNLL